MTLLVALALLFLAAIFLYLQLRDPRSKADRDRDKAELQKWLLEKYIDDSAFTPEENAHRKAEHIKARAFAITFIGLAGLTE